MGGLILQGVLQDEMGVTQELSYEPVVINVVGHFLFLQFLCERLNRIYQQSLLTVEEEEREKKEKGGTIAVQLGFKRPRKNERRGSGREREGRRKEREGGRVRRRDEREVGEGERKGREARQRSHYAFKRCQ